MAGWLAKNALGLLGVGGDIFGASSSASAIRAANESNERIAKENRQFQERMSSTAFQRAYTDMKAAGINPILAAGSQASSPGGSTATMQNAGAPFEGIGSKAMQNMYSAAQLKVAENTAEKIEADTRLTNVQADKLTDVTEPIGDAADAYRSVRQGVQNKGVRTKVQDVIDFIKKNHSSRIGAVRDILNSAEAVKEWYKGVEAKPVAGPRKKPLTIYIRKGQGGK